jgi:hypothetical protein
MTDTLLIRVNPKAKQVVVQESKLRGTDQSVIATRVLEWFGTLDPAVRSVILKQVEPSHVPNLLKLLAKSLGQS